MGLKRGTTDEWVKLSYNDTVLYAAKNHEFLSIDGDFKSLQNLMDHTNNNQIHIIDENANIISANYEIINVDADTTYNFDVEGLHTYIAGGIRVHNDCNKTYFMPNFHGLSQSDKDKLYDRFYGNNAIIS